jgi:hypothetical protein
MKRGYISSQYNLWGKMGNTDHRYVKLLNRQRVPYNRRTTSAGRAASHGVALSHTMPTQP